METLPQPMTPARPVREALRGPIAAAIVALAVEVITRATGVKPEPRLWELLAVVYAAFAGGSPAAGSAIVLGLAYCAYYFSPRGPEPETDVPFLLAVYLLAAVGAAGMVIVLRRRVERASGLLLQQERGRSLEAERAQAALNRAVINSLPAHLAVLDRSGKIVATNLAWDRFSQQGGGTPASVGAGADYLAACESDAKETARGIRDVLDGRVPEFSAEYPSDTPTEKKWFFLIVTPLEGGRGAVVAHLDITERRAAEEALRERAADLAHIAASLKRTNQELDQFAYITSHDLRAPLRGIANLSSWIEEDMGPAFTPEAHQQMALLRGRVHRMEAMIDGILEYSRVGRVRGNTQHVDTAMLVAEVMELIDPPAHITIEVQPGMPVVWAEKLRLGQVFQNLIGNAIKYHDKPEGRVTIACQDKGEFYEFTVTDNGPGIEPQFHEKIFVIFQTLQPRDKVEGTGVGLSLVKKIVEQAGGRIKVESALGSGAAFSFTWPKRAG